MFLSIITVCFNSEKTIRQTFESVLQQEFTDYEYIIIDGLSTDGTIDIIKEYLPKFNGKMRYISEKDKGIYDAMNKAISMAKGEIIGLVNSDDYFEKDAFQRVFEAAKAKPGMDVYYGCVRVLTPEDKEIKVYRMSHEMLYSCPMAHGGCFIARKAHERYGLYDITYRISADYDFLLRVFLQGGKFCPIDYVLANFRMGGVSSDGNNVPEHLKVQYKYGLISRKGRLISLWIHFVKQFLRKLLKRPSL